MSAAVLLMVAAMPLMAQVASDANAGYRTHEGRERVGAALGDPARDARQRPKELVAALGIRPGSTVVDLGTGVGYMLPYLSHAVGGRGRVVGEDIAQDFLDDARKRASAAHLENVTFVLGTERDPRLPAGAADLVLVLDAYHHFDYPQEMLARIGEGLRPGGRLAIVEYYKRRGAMGPGDPDRPLTHIRLDADGVVKEVEAAGYTLLWRRDHVPGSQYIAMFAKK